MVINLKQLESIHGVDLANILSTGAKKVFTPPFQDWKFSYAEKFYHPFQPLAEGKPAKYVFPIGGVLNKQLLLNALAAIEILQQPSVCHDSEEEVGGSTY